ncbi:MAG: transposase [Verrucomicrobia bacterium]|nr:MAG: transposase [Verrucomicrobiota bacterium]
MGQRSYQRYTPEFKEQALGLLALGKLVAEVARELQISSNLLYGWRSQSQRTQGGSGQSRALGEPARPINFDHCMSRTPLKMREFAQIFHFPNR